MFSFHQMSLRRVGFNATLALALISLTACASDRPQRGMRRDMQVIKVSMQATGEFYHGQLHVEANVKNGDMRRPKGAGDKGNSDSSSKRGGRSGGSMTMGGGMGGGDRMEGGGRMGGGMRKDEGESRETGSRFNRMESNQPPILLTLRLENTGTENLSITIRDIDSALGNFVPQPEHLELTPGQSAELEPMISRLGVIANEIPLQLSFGRAGQVESQTIILKSNLPDPDPSLFNQ